MLSINDLKLALGYLCPICLVWQGIHLWRDANCMFIPFHIVHQVVNLPFHHKILSCHYNPPIWRFLTFEGINLEGEVPSKMPTFFGNQLTLRKKNPYGLQCIKTLTSLQGGWHYSSKGTLAPFVIDDFSICSLNLLNIVDCLLTSDQFRPIEGFERTLAVGHSWIYQHQMYSFCWGFFFGPQQLCYCILKC